MAQHLFIGIFITDLGFYTAFIWPINMLILGVASVGVFIEKGKWKSHVRNMLFLLVLALPYTKLLAAFWGIAGQFYSVILVGILIGKFSVKTGDN